MESRYKIDSFSNGFNITGEDRQPVKVVLNRFDTGFIVEGLNWHKEEMSLVSGRKMIETVAHVLMYNWTPKPRDSDKKVNVKKLKIWATTQTKKALAKRIKAERLRIIDSIADPKVVKIQKAVFAANGSSPAELLKPSLYQKNEYYLKDVVKFRAAALTVGRGFEQDNDTRDFLTNKDWKQLYVGRGKETYTSLNKTLMNFPGGVPPHLLYHFQRIHLVRPIYTRRELIFLLDCAGHYHWGDYNIATNGWDDNEDDDILRLAGIPNPPRRVDHLIGDDIRNVIMKANADEITRAAKRLGDHLRTPLNLRKSIGLMQVSQYIMDAAVDLEHNGNLVGLMDKAIEWHRADTVKKVGLPHDKQTALPPIPLPTDKGIIFLKDVGEVVHEGEVQHHCIGSYAKHAVRNQCYLFHIEHNGETASAQVNAITGEVSQCYGPCNRVNKASVWATKKLNEWGKGFKEVALDKNQLEFIDDIPF